MSRGRIKVFLNAPLSTLAEQQLNGRVLAILSDLGFEYYAPQHVIPPGSDMPASRILDANMRAINGCDLMLSILDKPGLGVVFEVGYALALNKPVAIFRSDKQDYLGKIMEGFWDMLDPALKATNLEELRELLEQVKKGGLNGSL